MKKLKFSQFGKFRMPEFANARDLIAGPMPSSGLDRCVGQVFFANDSMLVESAYSEPLTNYLVGWRDPNNIEATLEFFAPRVPVGARRFEWKAAVNAEEFLSEIVDDQRAIGADFKRIAYTGTDVTDKTLNRGLTYIADLDAVLGPNWQNEKAAKVKRRLLRNSLRRSVALIDAASVNVPYTWDKSAGVNPDQDIRNDLVTAADISGIRPNRVAYGDGAFNLRMQAYGAQNNPAGFLGYGSSAVDSLAASLMVDQVLVSKERYQSAASAKSQILGNVAYSFFAVSGVDPEDPSNVKRFVTQFSEEQGGGFERVYVQQLSSKLVAITVEYYEKTVITYASGIRKQTITGPQ